MRPTGSRDRAPDCRCGGRDDRRFRGGLLGLRFGLGLLDRRLDGAVGELRDLSGELVVGQCRDARRELGACALERRDSGFHLRDEVSAGALVGHERRRGLPDRCDGLLRLRDERVEVGGLHGREVLGCGGEERVPGGVAAADDRDQTAAVLASQTPGDQVVLVLRKLVHGDGSLSSNA